MLHDDRLAGNGGEVQGDTITGLHRNERAPFFSHLEAKDIRQKFRGFVVIQRMDDRVIQLDRHCGMPP
ncbi:hypothetical protein GCM10009579_78730 [Streptomyces javensis]|uniref:Uncharacterized protein n=1 Tax=Streptomyces javensis TaxID=114698 RepID=A0ABN1XES8_9ACTN